MKPPAGLLAKYDEERVMRYMRQLLHDKHGRAFVGLSKFVLDLEAYGLVIIPGRRADAAEVLISRAGRDLVVSQSETQPRPESSG